MTRRPTTVPRFAFKAGLVLIFCAAALGCASRSQIDDEPRERAAGSLAAALDGPSECNRFAISAPRSAVLGDAFSASVQLLAQAAGARVSYGWDGDGLRIVSQNGRIATLSCAWSGWQTIAVTVTVADCSATRTAQVECKPSTCADTSKPCPGVAVPRSEALLCPKTDVLVRIRRDRDCPDEIPGSGGQWVGGSLLDAHYGDDDERPRFCSYYWNGPPANAPDTRVLPEEAEAWQWDCPRVAAHGAYAEMNAALAAHGRTHLGSLQWKSNAISLDPVRVAVIDTAAHLWRDADNNPHGRAVGALVLDAACAGAPNCTLELENHLALPLYRDTSSLPGQVVIRRDVLRGGGFGSRGHLARAIIEAVKPASGTRTILNLSVAYDSDELPASLLPERSDFGNRVVLEALRYARCHGALILAAAGNGPVPVDPGQAPGLPARWTALPALSEQECLKRFGFARFSDQAAPLLYGVSGVGFGAEPLMTTRGAGQSVLAALGLAAVRENPSGGGYTRMLTGTSMATAAVSGIAASLWAHAGALAPDAVIQELYAVSPTTGIQPDFKPFAPVSPSSSFQEVRRITLCSIAWAHPELATCELPPIPIATLPGGILPDLPEGSLEQESTPEVPVEPGVSPWKFPWIFPQPEGDPPCGACGLKLPFPRLEIAFRPSFPVSTIHNMRLFAIGSVALSVGASNARLAMSETLDDSSLTPVASFTPLDVPFSVDLDASLLGSPMAAELAYRVEVDGVLVDATASVLLE